MKAQSGMNLIFWAGCWLPGDQNTALTGESMYIENKN